MSGLGLPVARQRSATLDPSRTVTSLELNSSSILGGTGKERNTIEKTELENASVYDNSKE